MKTHKGNTLILGIGNDILTDDGIGPKLVGELEKSLPVPGVVFRTAATGGLEIVEMMQGYEQVIIMDAIKTKNGTPGEVYHLTPAHFRETLHVSNFHDISFLPALEMAKKMKIPLPQKIDIIAIEIVEDLEFSESFSPPVAARYPQIYQKVMNIVQSLLAPS